MSCWRKRGAMPENFAKTPGHQTILNLTQVQPGESGVIVEIQGGHGLIKKIQANALVRCYRSHVALSLG